MRLLVNKNLSNNVYTVELQTTDFDTTDLELFGDFGEPTVDLGGALKEIVDGVETTVATLPQMLRKVKSGFPFKQTFTKQQYNDNAKKVAELWAQNAHDKITLAMGDLRMKIDDFSGTEDIII